MFIDIDNLIEPKAIKKIVSFFHGKQYTAARINIRIDPARLYTSNYLRYFDSRYLGARNIPEGTISTRFFASDGIILTRILLIRLVVLMRHFIITAVKMKNSVSELQKQSMTFIFYPMQGQKTAIHLRCAELQKE